MTTSNRIERRRVYGLHLRGTGRRFTPPRRTERRGVPSPGPRAARRQCDAHTTRSPAFNNIP
eukprot:6481000-Prymnesium_polylepis.1